MSTGDLTAHMDVGAPVTYEEMMQIRAGETLASTDAVYEEKNPFIFEDGPVGSMRYCVISMLSNSLRQKHNDGGNYMKIRATFTTEKETVEGVAKLDSEKCDMYAYEMYKFCAFPCSEAFRSMTDEERDNVLNSAMRAYKHSRIEQNIEYERRKKAMMKDIERQESDKAKIRDGTLDPSALNSSSVMPEPVLTQNKVISKDVSMKSDRPFNEYSIAVLAIVDLADVNEIPSALINSCIVKICGVFKSESEADAHATQLRKSVKYKHIDLYVCSLYEWLKIPPSQEEIEMVRYTNEKLTEVLGAKTPQATPTEIYTSLQEEGVLCE